MRSRYLIFLLLVFTKVKCDEWWHRVAKRQGPMVCVEESVRENERYFSTPWTGGKLCGIETIVRFSCCHGYDRIPGERGCPLVLPLRNLAETARSVGAAKFIDHAESSGLLPLLANRGAFTLFAPRDSAFDRLTTEQEKAVNSTSTRQPVLLYTIADGRLPVDDLPATVATRYRHGSVIITKFPNGMVTANCIPLVKTDLEATNGVLHVTESLLFPIGHTTVIDYLMGTPELSTMATAVSRAHLRKEFKDKGPFTIFAPVDAAWEALPQAFLEAIMEDSNSIKALLHHHILHTVWCSAASGGEIELQTLQDTTVRLWCNETGQFIEDAQLLEGDHPTGNGFVHRIDKVLIPDRARSLSDLMQSRDVTYFLKMAEVGGLGDVLKRQGSYTVFAPSDEIFEDLSNETLSELMTQPSLARSVASYHIVSGRHVTSSFIDGQNLGTLKGQQPVLRIKLHRELLTLESSLVTLANVETRNGVLHILNRILTPPTLTVTQVLEEKGNFSVFLDILNQTEPNLLKALGNASETFTVFAPEDSVFNQTPGIVTRLLADPPLLFQMAAHHIVKSFIVSNGMIPGLTYQHTDFNGRSVALRRENEDGTLTVDNMAMVEDPEITATNGVIHKLSRFLQL